MGIYLNPDNAMFQFSLDSKFYVDKTRIAILMNDRIGRDSRFVCVSRPRRFGKSCDADMLVAYYTRGANSQTQFDGLDVSRSDTYQLHLNAHDVIKLDITQIAPYAKSRTDIAATVTASLLPELREAWPEVLPADENDLSRALELIRQHKKSGFIVIIDEWDSPMRETSDEALQRSYLEFLRNLLKSRAYVEACYMTGILPIKKYGVHSALNMFTEYTMIDPKGFASLMGFTDREVKRLCGKFGMDYEEMARWYDGYLLGSTPIHVYNPRSVAGAIMERSYSSFWTSTETYEALQVYIDMDFDGIQQELVAMLDGQHVPAEVADFENDMSSLKSKDDMYALLVHLGYLGYDEADGCVFIPNEEIRREFATSIRTGSRAELARLIRDSRELQCRTLAGDEAWVADSIARAHDSAAGPHHYNDEQALRAAVKLAYIWSIDDYLRIDELPGGRGYADVVFLPKPGSSLPPMVIELKWNRPVQTAIEQVRQRDYPAALRGMTGECVLVGITYDESSDRHDCKIERVRL